MGAEQWFARLRAPDCTVAERRAFDRWKAESADRAREYAEIKRLYERSAELRSDPAIVAATQAVIRRAPRIPLLRHLAYLSLLPMALAALVWIIPWHRSPMPEKIYATRVGERQSLILTDGSTILLDTDTSVAVRLGDAQRAARLIKGQAQFQVVHNASSPFTVNVGAGVVRDIGTEFQVRANGVDVTVTVLEGAVAVSAPRSKDLTPRSVRLGPGQQLAFDNSGSPWMTRSVNLKLVTSWTTGDLTFEDDSLEHVVHEMNRYTRSQIRLADPGLRTVRISGVFHAGDQQSFILSLQHGWSIRTAPVPSGDFDLYSH